MNPSFLDSPLGPQHQSLLSAHETLDFQELLLDLGDLLFHCAQENLSCPEHPPDLCHL